MIGKDALAAEAVKDAARTAIKEAYKAFTKLALAAEAAEADLAAMAAEVSYIPAYGVRYRDDGARHD